MEQKTKIVLAWELHEQGISNSQIAKRLAVNRETINRWIAAVTAQGLLPYLEQFRAAERKPRPSRQVSVSTKQLVWWLREREENCCGQKIAYFLEKEHGIHLSVPTIYVILSERYKLRQKGRKKTARGTVPEADAPRQVVQMDTIDFGSVFAFTAVDILSREADILSREADILSREADILSREADILSREADILLRPSLTAKDGLTFLQFCLPRRFDGFVQLIQTDGGSEFEAEFSQNVTHYCEHHRVSRPYKKNEQSYIESFNRTVRSECWGWLKYKPQEIAELTPQVEAFLTRYHYHRPHMGFDPMRPPLPLENL